MRNILIVFSILFSIESIAQTSSVPGKFRFQAALRDPQGTLVTGNVALTINIHQTNASGTIVFGEQVSTTASNYGIINFEIGNGTAYGGYNHDLRAVDFGNGNYYIDIKKDGISVSTQQLVSVPYALYAFKADTAKYAQNQRLFPFDTVTVHDIWGNHFYQIYADTGLLRLGNFNNGLNSGIEIRNGQIRTINQYRVSNLYPDGLLIQSDTTTFNSSFEQQPSSANYYNYMGNISISEEGFLGGNANYSNIQGATLAGISANLTGCGWVYTYGSQGYKNVEMQSRDINENYGWVGVYNYGTPMAGITINNDGQGLVWGDVKSFRMNHPTDSTKEIWYASIEGPEVAAYERGTATLENGEAQITLSAHFALVASGNNITVQTTPLFAASKGLAVIERTTTSIKVKELWNGTGNYKFDWEIKDTRKNFENWEVIRDKKSNGVNPSKAKVITPAIAIPPK